MGSMDVDLFLKMEVRVTSRPQKAEEHRNIKQNSATGAKRFIGYTSSILITYMFYGPYA